MFRTVIALVVFFLLVGVVLWSPRENSGELSADEVVTELVTPPEISRESGMTPREMLSARIMAKPFNLVPFIIFGLAVLHAFCTGWLHQLGQFFQRRLEAKHRAKGRIFQAEKRHSFIAEVCYFLGEVEVVFSLWVIPLIIAISYQYSWHAALAYLNSRNYTEPLFVVVVMVLTSTRPVLQLSEQIIQCIARIGGGSVGAWWFTLLTIGPFLGSLITEPAAMTITALILSKRFFLLQPRKRFAYATLGLLFTNISMGGILTHFAAPAVLIVADKWNWTTPFMFMVFGWKALISVVISNTAYFMVFRKDLEQLRQVRIRSTGELPEPFIPVWLTVVHVGFVVWLVIASHDLIVLVGTFLIFLGFFQATRPHQRPLNLRPPLLVGLFLAGLVIHGGLQGWWIEPLLSEVNQFSLLALTLVLSPVNDNASITYLGSLVPNFTLGQQYAVMTGAVTAGGLTVIANGPNPAGVQLLRHHFKGGIAHMGLLLGALPAAVIGVIVLVLLGWPIMFS